jgi:hypothetical protein
MAGNRYALYGYAGIASLILLAGFWLIVFLFPLTAYLILIFPLFFTLVPLLLAFFFLGLVRLGKDTQTSLLRYGAYGGVVVYLGAVVFSLPPVHGSIPLSVSYPAYLALFLIGFSALFRGLGLMKAKVQLGILAQNAGRVELLVFFGVFSLTVFISAILFFSADLSRAVNFFFLGLSMVAALVAILLEILLLLREGSKSR